MPTLCLFQRILKEPHGRVHITLADYNVDVLRLVTIPNMLLTWMMVTQTSTDANPWKLESDVEVAVELLANFMSDLNIRGIHLDAISGPWGQHFIDLIPQPQTLAHRLILGSESIYSPGSLTDFLQVLRAALQSSQDARALIATKKFYFGVGGGVDEFVRKLEKLRGTARSVRESGGEGVARVVLEVSLK